jgi:hypothetical protein
LIDEHPTIQHFQHGIRTFPSNYLTFHSALGIHFSLHGPSSPGWQSSRLTITSPASRIEHLSREFWPDSLCSFTYHWTFSTFHRLYEPFFQPFCTLWLFFPWLALRNPGEKFDIFGLYRSWLAYPCVGTTFFSCSLLLCWIAFPWLYRAGRAIDCCNVELKLRFVTAIRQDMSTTTSIERTDITIRRKAMIL